MINHLEATLTVLKNPLEDEVYNYHIKNKSTLFLAQI